MFYIDKETKFIFETKMFEDHVLVRPLTRNTESVVEKINYAEFTDRFEEFLGDPDGIYEILGDGQRLIEAQT